MANIQYDDLLPYVLPEVHGCSDPLAEQAIRDAVIEFCRQSYIWNVICDPADVIAGQSTYDIDLPSGTALVRVESVRLAGKVLIDPAALDNLDRQRRSNWDTKEGETRFYSQVDDESIICSPVPTGNQANGLLVRLTVKPSRTSSGFPNWINERYQDAIVAGAKARLMLKQGTEWYNPSQGATYEEQFHAGWSGAREDAAGSLGRAPLRTTSQH